jgi:hypothetical protein
MSNPDDVVCGRCGGTNRPGRPRCWVCYSPLGPAEAEPATGGEPAPTLRVAPRAHTKSPLITALKIVFVLCCVVAMVPVLLFVTCVGIVIFAK